MKRINKIKIFGAVVAMTAVCAGGTVAFAGDEVIKVFTGADGQKMELIRPEGYVEPENAVETPLEPSSDPAAIVNIENPNIGDIVKNEDGQEERVIGIDGEGGFITELIEDTE